MVKQLILEENVCKHNYYCSEYKVWFSFIKIKYRFFSNKMPLRYLLCKGSNLTITPKQVQINQRSDLKITPVLQWLTRKKMLFFKFYCYHLKHLRKIKYHGLTRKIHNMLRCYLLLYFYPKKLEVKSNCLIIIKRHSFK